MSQLAFLQGFTFFEIHYIIKHLIYPNIFSTALWVSRMIDEDPNLTVRYKLQEAQKKVSRGLILSELITNDERTRPQKDWIVSANPDDQRIQLDEPVI